jgi:SAM-dependent methyltransferase
MERIDDNGLVRREYASLDRLARRRLDVTGWVRGLDQFDTFLEAVAEVRPQRVLDAGAGRGDYAAVIAAPEVVCVDQSEAAVEEARARGLDALVADLADLPFIDGEFDAVICNHVLYHLSDRDRGIAEIARVLRPGGRFAGIYNFRDHLAEVWSAVGDPWGEQPDFDCESGGGELARHFERVECRPTAGSVVWLAREDLQTYLDAYSEMLGRLKAPDGPYPFVAKRHNCVLVADKGVVRSAR